MGCWGGFREVLGGGTNFEHVSISFCCLKCVLNSVSSLFILSFDVFREFW